MVEYLFILISFTDYIAISELAQLTPFFHFEYSMFID